MTGSEDDDQREQMHLFDEAFHRQIRPDILASNDSSADMSQALKWLERVLLYNVPHGSKEGGLTVVNTYRHLASSSSCQDMELVRMAGWSVELVQACYAMMNDIMDHQSMDRRGQPCWYRNV